MCPVFNRNSSIWMMLTFPSLLYKCNCFSISWLISLVTGKGNASHLLSSNSLPMQQGDLHLFFLYSILSRSFFKFLTHYFLLVFVERYEARKEIPHFSHMPTSCREGLVPVSSAPLPAPTFTELTTAQLKCYPL